MFTMTLFRGKGCSKIGTIQVSYRQIKKRTVLLLRILEYSETMESMIDKFKDQYEFIGQLSFGVAGVPAAN